MRRLPNLPRRAARARAAALVLALCSAVAVAQSGASVLIGHGGAVVAGAWNPIQIQTRDAGPLVLEISVDQGSLREGEIPFSYMAEVAGGTGLATFTDDVFLPPWRVLQWRLSGPDALVASGALAAREVDTRPLHLVVSQRGGTWRSLYGANDRVLERNGPDLPSRAAAFDGVATVLVDGSTAPPRPEAVLAAAATGATVLLVGDLPSGYADVALLADEDRVMYGNGSIVRTDAAGARAHLAGAPALDPSAARDALAETLVLDPPQTIGTGPILLLAGAYAIAVMLALRFGRLAGVAAALALAAVGSVAAWGALRPETVDFRAAAAVEIGAGGIARRATVTRLLTLPAQVMQVDGSAALLERSASAATPEALQVPLERWGTATVATPPSIAGQRLAWSDGALVNRSDVVLTDVFVLGVGPQGRLAAGVALRPVPAEDAVLPPSYDHLLAYLPDGSALARDGRDVLVALPEGRDL